MPTRFWELGVGCLLSLWPLAPDKGPFAIWSWLKRLLPWLLVGVFLMPTTHPVLVTVATVFGSGLLIVALAKDGPTTGFLARAKMVKIGQMSYSLYLWHWGVIAISRWTLGIHLWSIPFQVLLIFGIS